MCITIKIKKMLKTKEHIYTGCKIALGQIVFSKLFEY